MWFDATYMLHMRPIFEKFRPSLVMIDLCSFDGNLGHLFDQILSVPFTIFLSDSSPQFRRNFQLTEMIIIQPGPDGRDLINAWRGVCRLAQEDLRTIFALLDTALTDPFNAGVEDIQRWSVAILKVFSRHIFAPVTLGAKASS